MEIRRHDLPPSHRSPRSGAHDLLAAIASVQQTWRNAGMNPITERCEKGRIKLDPDFGVELAVEIETRRQTARAEDAAS